jgi:hypothetical protein
MVDLGLKQEIEKESDRQKERMLMLSKKFNKFTDEMINEHQISSVEFQALLNNRAAIDIEGRLENEVNRKAQQTLMRRNQILNKN